MQPEAQSGGPQPGVAESAIAKPLWRAWVLGFKRELVDTFSPVAGYPAVGEFHLQFWRFVIAQAFCGLLPFLVAYLLVPRQYHVWVTGALIIKLIFGALASAVIVSRYYPVHVSREGIRARNPAGIACRLRWEEMTRVDPVWWALLARYVRISSARKKDAIWLPLYLKDMKGFAALVREHAPADNPLRRFLEQHVH
jgi:hypothetical protein